ncbi:hypothetical protein [Nostoc parmelioides]|uniref:Uncharacterized protein n=1 Tax=Nostoc parmelioides FACHB-3921 TaxID=2692909 RepID=A0ABR8BN83_9NOSO|nr:hypothetical protein [Nostoc parmelioides]MBD2254692.1 hypothetical protein [Nostoc parmelioides FACHB-3921]
MAKKQSDIPGRASGAIGRQCRILVIASYCKLNPHPRLGDHKPVFNRMGSPFCPPG